MNVLTLAVLVHVFAKNGLLWEGAAMAWFVALCADVVLLALMIVR